MQMGRCCGCFERLPVIGSVYRAAYGTLVADYLGISTASFTTGTTGATDNWNILYYHFTTPNAKTTAVPQVILGPVRWASAVPASSGGNYDFWSDTSNPVGTTPRHEVAGGVNPIGGMCKSFLPVSGDSHIEPPASGGIAIGHTDPLSGIKSVPVSGAAFSFPTIDAISPGLLAWSFGYGNASAGFYYKEHTVRVRINGSLATPDEAGQYTVAAGDEIEYDVWYFTQFNPVRNLPNNFSWERKFCNYIFLSRVSNSSLRPNTLSGAHNWGLIATGYDTAANFDVTIHTYEITINGSMTWTLPDGTTGPMKLRTGSYSIGGQWLLSSTNDGVLSFTCAITLSEPPGIFRGLRLYWKGEHVWIELLINSAWAASAGLQNRWVYSPSADGNYLTSTFARDQSGTITHAPLGCFDQGGTTTFDLVDWTPPYTNPGFPHGRRSGIVPVDPEVPTSLTITRTTI